MIAIVDYGMGNLRSVSKALEHLGADVCVSSQGDEIIKADKLVLPGVGAFGDAMQELNRLQLTDSVKEYVRSGKPFLGICLGLQLLFEQSEESQGVPGLGLFEGEVRRFQSKGIKVPHMGWNQMKIERVHPLLSGVPDQSYFYFVHSFYAVPKQKEVVAGICRYGEEDVTSALADQNIFAVQFHPEKSQKAGLKILENFIHWKP